jgi:hypothetical protein
MTTGCEPDVVRCDPVRARLAGQLDHVGHQVGHLLELVGEVGDHALALGGLQPVPAAERLDVRPERRQRGAQLVRGIGDQAALRRLRALQRGHHLVEARSQAAQLVVAADLDAPRQVVRAGHLLGRVRDLARRRQGGARHHRPKRRRHGDAAGADQEQDQDQRGKRVLRLLEGCSHLDSAAVGEWLGQHPQRRCVVHLDAAQKRFVQLDVREAGLAAAHRQLPVGGGNGDRELRLRRPHDGAVGADDLAQGGRRPRRPGRARRNPPLGVAVQPHRSAVGLAAQLVVHLVAQAVADQDVDDGRCQDHGQRHRRSGEQRQPPAQAHFSLTA